MNETYFIKIEISFHIEYCYRPSQKYFIPSSSKSSSIALPDGITELKLAAFIPSAMAYMAVSSNVDEPKTIGLDIFEQRLR